PAPHLRPSCGCSGSRRSSSRTRSATRSSARTVWTPRGSPAPSAPCWPEACAPAEGCAGAVRRPPRTDPPVAAAASAPWLLGRSAQRAARRGVVVPGGEDQRRPVGHLQRVLRVGAAGAVGRELGPAIALVHHELGGGGHEERLDGDQLPGHELDAAAGG